MVYRTAPGIHIQPPLVITSLLEQAPDWLTRREYTPKFRFFNLRGSKRPKRSIRAASFARTAPQDVCSRLCIDLTCKSLALNASFASGVNAPWSINPIKPMRASDLPVFLYGAETWRCPSSAPVQLILDCHWLVCVRGEGLTDRSIARPKTRNCEFSLLFSELWDINWQLRVKVQFWGEGRGGGVLICSQNYEFISHSYDFLTRNCEFISRNYEKKSELWDKSHNYLFYFLFSGRNLLLKTFPASVINTWMCASLKNKQKKKYIATFWTKS